MNHFSTDSFFAAFLQVARHDISALVLMGLGVVLMLSGLWWGVTSVRRRHEDPPKALALLRGFRVGVVGLCLSAYGAGWWWRLDWLMTVSLVICLEELAESSFYIAVLKRARM
jgi:hypothetical protein